MVEVSQLSIGYLKKRSCIEIQRELNFSIGKGELVCLIGPNGCGKSTLLRTLTGLQPSLVGSIRIGDQEVTHLKASERSKLYSYVLTESVSSVALTVRQVVSLGRVPYTDSLGRMTEFDEHLVSESLAQVNLSHKEHSTMRELSDGERQRVMIAKALAQQTELVILDEPTAHLDLPNRFEIMTLLHRLTKEKGRTVLLSTHELELSLQIADRIIMMVPAAKGGGIVEGMPEDLVIDGELQKLFSNNVLRFDPHVGLFRIEHSRLWPITLISRGEGYLTAWTTKALARVGYYTQPDSSVRVVVDERHHHWTIDGETGSYSAASIGQMIDLLEKDRNRVLRGAQN